MIPTVHGFRRGLGTALVGVLLLLGVGLAASPAAAHAQLISSTPAEGTVVATAPEAIRLEFNERIQVDAEDTHVFVGDGSEVEAETVSSDRIVTVTPGSELPEGTVVVSYSVTSADGHRIGGSVTFAVCEPTPGSSSSEVFTEPVTTGVPVVFAAATAVALVAGLGLLLLAVLGLRRRGDVPSPARAKAREVCWTAGLTAAVVAIPLGVVDRGKFGWSGLLAWEHWIDGFLTWRGLLVLVALVAAAVAVASLRRTSAGVAVVAALALALAGGASIVAPGADPVPVTDIPAGAPVGEVTSGETTVRVTFQSLMVGTTEVKLELLDSDGNAVKPFAAPKMGIHSDAINLGDVTLEKESSGVFGGNVTLPDPGEWIITVSLRIDKFTNPVLELPFDVGRPALPGDSGGGH